MLPPEAVDPVPGAAPAAPSSAEAAAADDWMSSVVDYDADMTEKEEVPPIEVGQRGAAPPPAERQPADPEPEKDRAPPAAEVEAQTSAAEKEVAKPRKKSDPQLDKQPTPPAADVEVETSAFEKGVAGLSGKRKVIPTMVKIGDEYVKRQNLYDMDSGENKPFELDKSFDGAFKPRARGSTAPARSLSWPVWSGVS